MKAHFVIIAMVLGLGLAVSGCAECTDSDCEQPTVVGVEPPEDSFLYADFGPIETRIQLYVDQLEGHRDSYGIYLPIKNGDTFIDQGDALIWNSLLLAAYCRINMDLSFNLDSIIERDWWLYKDNFILQDGRPIRHPDLADGLTKSGSISKDGLTGFYVLGAVAYDTSCEPVKSEFSEVVTRVAKYAKGHDWLLGAPGSGKKKLILSYLLNRIYLSDLLQLYGERRIVKRNRVLVDLSEHASNDAGEFRNKTKCLRGDDIACIQADKNSSTTWHLHHENLISHAIFTKHDIEDPYYTRKQIGKFRKSMAKIGRSDRFRDGTTMSNWLFVLPWRINSGRSYFDIVRFLTRKFTDQLPNKSTPIGNWKCTVMIWQRNPLENKCDPDRDEEYLGLDFLIPASYMVQHRARIQNGLQMSETEFDSDDDEDDDIDQR